MWILGGSNNEPKTDSAGGKHPSQSEQDRIDAEQAAKLREALEEAKKNPNKR